MPRDVKPRDDPAERFLLGVDFIEANLSEHFGVAEVAAAAGVSPYHYARKFQALTGDTVMGYARKRRLTEAAHKLANGGRAEPRLIDLAVESGFESQAAFTRAFKRQFGVTPGEVQRRDNRWLPRTKAPLDRATLSHLKESVTMEPTIIERGDIHVVGLCGSFDQESSVSIPDLWRRFNPEPGEIPNVVPDRYWGVIEMTNMDVGEFDYSVALEVTEPGAPPEGMVANTLPGGRFAVFTHKIRTVPFGAELRQTMRYIYGTWVERSEECLRTWYELELYDERFNRGTMGGELDIYVPIM